MSMRHIVYLQCRVITLRQALAFPEKHFLRSETSIERMDTCQGLNLVPCAHHSMLMS